MAKDGAPFGIDRDATTMDNEGVAILEDAYLADWKCGLRWKSGLRREIGPPGRQRPRERRWDRGAASENSSFWKTVSAAADSTRPPPGIMPREEVPRQIWQGLPGPRPCPGANAGV